MLAAMLAWTAAAGESGGVGALSAILVNNAGKLGQAESILGTMLCL